MAERNLDSIDEAVALHRLDSPDDADVYTREWVLEACSDFGMTPDEYLAYLLKIKAEMESGACDTKPYPEDMPEWVKIKFGKATDDGKGGY